MKTGAMAFQAILSDTLDKSEVPKYFHSENPIKNKLKNKELLYLKVYYTYREVHVPKYFHKHTHATSSQNKKCNASRTSETSPSAPL